MNVDIVETVASLCLTPDCKVQSGGTFLNKQSLAEYRYTHRKQTNDQDQDVGHQVLTLLHL